MLDKDNQTEINNNVKIDRIQITSHSNSKINQSKANIDVTTAKKQLTPYQKYKQSRNQNGKKYFEFYDDVKVYTHNIYDW